MKVKIMGSASSGSPLGGEITVLPDISLGHRGFNTFYGNLKFQANYFNL